MTSPRRLVIVVGAATGVAASVVAFAFVRDPVFWDRYLHAYTFDSFVEHPFPLPERLYPQEVVRGTPAPRELPVAQAGRGTIGDAALQAAAEFAERTHSTALLVSHDGIVQFEGYWQGAGPDTPLYSFSMHKTVVGLLVGAAIAEGAISSVDDPVADYLPAWAEDEHRAVTLRNLLQMNSGLEPMQFPRNPFSRHVKRQIGTDLAATALGFPLANEPGTAFDYNGVNPTLLVMVLEAATGQRYADYLSRRLWQPLGNRDAAVWLDREGGLARGATSLYATARDWLRVGEMLLDNGRVGDQQVISPAWLEAMLAPSATNPKYGYLVWLGSAHVEERTLDSFRGFAATEDERFAAPDIFYLDGLGGQRVYIVPSRRVVIVRTGILAKTWEDTYLPNVIVAGIRG